ncbi:MAG: LysR family transcriptional regulator [Proteobacteria bacterium]|nr:LysR family transcriptional regulator [Pseudomonadota bacterium]
MLKIELKDLEIFYWVAQLGSFRGAAERLHTTQPAISQRIANLEHTLGVKVIERGARTSTLTPRGRMLLEYAERILRLSTEMVQSVADHKTLSGVVRLGVAETIVHTWLSRLIEQVHARYPNIALDISVDVSINLRNALVAGQIDLAFLLGPVSEPSMVNLDLCRYPLAFIAGQAIDLGPEPVTLERLTSKPVITYPKTTRPYMALRQMLTRSDMANPRMYPNSSLSTIIKMTLEGIGVSVIPPAVIARELARGELRILATELTLPDLVFTATMGTTPSLSLAEPVARMAQEIVAMYNEP